MFRIAVVGSLLLGCTEKSKALPDEPLVPAFRIATLKCVSEIPAGWTTRTTPMPDQILEVIATAPTLRGRMVIREAVEPTIDQAVAEQKRRTEAVSGSQPDFALLREVALGEGRLLAYQWKRQASAPIERHLIAVLPIESKVVLAFIDDDGETPEAHLLATLGTLKCSPK